MYATDTLTFNYYIKNAPALSKRGIAIFGSMSYGFGTSYTPTKKGFSNNTGLGNRLFGSPGSYSFVPAEGGTDSIKGNQGDIIGNNLKVALNDYSLSGIGGTNTIYSVGPQSDSTNVRICLSSTNFVSGGISEPVPLAIRRKAQNYKTFRSGFNLGAYGSNTDRDTLISRLINWFNSDVVEEYGHTPRFDNRYNAQPTTLTNITEDVPFKYTAKISDLDVGQKLIASAVILPHWMTATVYNDSITVSGTPDIGAIPSGNTYGDTIFVLKVVDENTNNYNLQFTRLRVIHVNHKPVIGTNQPDVAYVNQPYQFQIEASDIDISIGDSVAYSLIDISKPWLSITPTGRLQGTPEASDIGTTTAKLIVEDMEGDTAQKVLQVVVQNSVISEVIKNSSSKNISIHSNVLNKTIDIDFNTNGKANFDIKIISVNGQTIYEENGLIVENKLHKVINISNKLQGLYILSIKNGKELFVSKIRIL
jgi:hypothetical protein